MWTDVKGTVWFQVLILESWGSCCFFSLIYFWLCWDLVADRLFSGLVIEGYSPVAVHGLLTVMASHCRARGLGHMDSVVMAPGFSCSVACGIFLDQR